MIDTEDQEQKLAHMRQDIDILKRMSKVKHQIAVMSGKGGVGKSTMAVNIAVALAKKGYKTGIMDVDIHGPNVPRMLNIEQNSLIIGEDGILPIKAMENLEVISMQFVLPSFDSPIIWRGPKKTSAIRQFLAEVSWNYLDVLVVDCPPGTGDEHLAILQSIQLDGIIMITTPHLLSCDDLKKSINMAKNLKVKIIGIIENMSEFLCPNCKTEIPIFGKENCKEIALEMGVPFLGSIPIEAVFTESDDLLIENMESETSKRIMNVVNKIENLLLKKEQFK